MSVKRLGRGLEALIRSKEEQTNEFVKNANDEIISKIYLRNIIINSNQPRKIFKESSIKELVESIKNNGLLTPITVRKVGKLFEIIAGERRYKAFKILNKNSIPAYVINVEEESEMLGLALIENIQRENLNAVEEASAYKKLLENQNIGHDSLSSIIGKSKSHISNMLRLLELDDEILNYIIEGKLSMGHARALIGVPNANVLAKEIINKQLNVRETEKKTSQFKRSKNNKKFKDPNIVDLEKELSEKIGLKTSIHFNQEGSSGSLTLFYSDLDQLDDIMKRLKK